MQTAINLTCAKDRDLVIPRSSGSYLDCALLVSYLNMQIALLIKCTRACISS